MTHKEFRQLCERTEHEPPEPGGPPQLRALVDVIDEMLKRRDREHRLTIAKLLMRLSAAEAAETKPGKTITVGEEPLVQDSEEWSESTTSAHLPTSVCRVGGLSVI
jgi:hypothetical protein